MRVVLYSKRDSVWKLADFGFATQANSRSLKFSRDGKGTDCYRAPELLSEDNRSYTNKVDIWSLGCILYELAVGRKAFSSDFETFQFQYKMKTLEVELDQYFGETCKELIRTDVAIMLEIDPTLRPSATTLRETFTHHFEMTELLDNDVDEPTIISSHSGSTEELIRTTESSRPSGPSQIGVPENIETNPLASSTKSTPDYSTKAHTIISSQSSPEEPVLTESSQTSHLSQIGVTGNTDINPPMFSTKSKPDHSSDQTVANSPTCTKNKVTLIQPTKKTPSKPHVE
jgi:serine/threonine protein kinase